MNRAILFDTETTGLDPLTGDRIVEIAALELIDDLPSGRQFHVLIDPERDVPEQAAQIHGYTRAHLFGKPKFADIVDEFLAFIGAAPLIAHNAPFDFGFIGAELRRLDMAPLDPQRMIDTLEIARARYPGLSNSLDALCRRHAIDLSERTTHNALLDCRLLAGVYLELIGGRQRGLELVAVQTGPMAVVLAAPALRTQRLLVPDAQSLAAHAAFLTTLSDPVWTRNQAG